MKKYFLLLAFSAVCVGDIHTVGYWKKVSGSVLLNVLDRGAFEIVPGTLVNCKINPLEGKLTFSTCDLANASVKFFKQPGTVASEGELTRVTLQEGIVAGKQYRSWFWFGQWKDKEVKSAIKLELHEWLPDPTLAGSFSLGRYPGLSQALDAKGQK